MGNRAHLVKCSIFHALTETRIVMSRDGDDVQPIFKVVHCVMVLLMFPHSVDGCVSTKFFSWDSMVAR